MFFKKENKFINRKNIKWNPVNTVTNGPKTFGRINGVAVFTRVFFLQENVWRFLSGGQKKVAVITRFAVRRGFTVMFFNNHVFARLSLIQCFSVQTSPYNTGIYWYIGLHKPKDAAHFSGNCYLSSCSLFFHVLTKHFTHRVFVQAQQQILQYVQCTSLTK